MILDPHNFEEDVTLARLVGRYVGARYRSAAKHMKRPIGWVEMVSATLVWGELFGLFQLLHPLHSLANCFVHPLAATGTFVVLLAHLDD